MNSFSIDKQRDKVNAEWMSRPVDSLKTQLTNQPLALVLISMAQSPTFAYRLKRKLSTGPIFGEAYTEKEPNNLPALEAFPEMVVAGGSSGYQFTTLADFEKRYDNMDPKNYGWYQCRLHVAGKNIYNAGGQTTFIKLWKGLKENKEKMTDEQFAAFLNNNVSHEVAKVQTDW